MPFTIEASWLFCKDVKVPQLSTRNLGKALFVVETQKIYKGKILWTLMSFKRCATEFEKVSFKGLEGVLKKLESLGVNPPGVYEEFLRSWRTMETTRRSIFHGMLNTHHSLATTNEPDVLNEYKGVIREQIGQYIVEIVNDRTRPVYYMFSSCSYYKDKSTTRLLIVHYASAKPNGALRNDCLHANPALTQSIFILCWRFGTTPLHSFVIWEGLPNCPYGPSR